MKLLKDKVNSGVEINYPLGKIRDDSGDGLSGSQVDAEFMNDYVQFMEKMFAESGLTANNLPDNGANGYQLFEGFKAYTRKFLRPYSIYDCQLIASSGVAPIAATTYINEITGITYSRVTTGQYLITIPSVSLNKVSINWTPNDYNNVGYSIVNDIYSSSGNVIISIKSENFGAAIQDKLNGFLQIRKYD